MQPPKPNKDNAVKSGYRLDDQVGFILRRVQQRHLAIFAAHIPDLTPTQFAALAKLCERGPLPQNELGRLTAMDAATIKGVVDRLRKRGFVASKSDPNDGRRLLVAASPEGARTFASLTDRAFAITRETLQPLKPAEQAQLIALLAKIV